jgi:hypothetical protein
MTNEEKVKRLERLATLKTERAARNREIAKDCHNALAEEMLITAGKFDADAALLREAAQLMRERGTLLTGSDWKGMYEALERDMAALRKEREGLIEKADNLQWCEDNRASVTHNAMTNLWTVTTEEPQPWRRRRFEAKTMKAALRAARGEK